MQCLALLNLEMDFPHPQPLSRRRGLEILFPLLWERADSSIRTQQQRPLFVFYNKHIGI